jgi:hypothetical protein
MGKGGLIKRDGGEKIGFVRQGDSWHLKFLKPGHKGLKTDGAFQDTKLAVKVEMDEFGAIHADLLLEGLRRGRYCADFLKIIFS